MAIAKSWKPEGTHTVTPHLTVAGAKAAIEFYKKAFGAEAKGVMADPSGVVMHAEIKIGDSMVYVNDEVPQMGARGPKSIGGSPVTMHLFVPDCDAVFNQAVAAGAAVKMPLMDMFWGDRYGQVQDPFGHTWAIATCKETLTPDEIWARMKDQMAKQGQH